MTLGKHMLVLCLSLTAAHASADSLSLDVGQARGDTVSDSNRFVRTLQNEYLAGPTVQGYQIEASYQRQSWSFQETALMWNLGLGTVEASASRSYPAGRVTVERQTNYAVVGFRVQDESRVPSLVLGAEFNLIQGLAGTVKLKAPTGTERYQEDREFLEALQQTLTVSLGYRLLPALIAQLKIRMNHGNPPNYFLGVAYAITGL